jgi:GDP-L-fucose synthase
VNIGIGRGISILAMAEMIQREIGYTGRIVLDPSKPDGAPYKTVDGSRGQALLNWFPEINFEDGVRATIRWYLEQKTHGNH